MSRKNKLLIVLLSVIFCFSAFTLSAYAVGEGDGEFSNVVPGDNQGGGENSGSNVVIPPENSGGDIGNGDNGDNNGGNGDNNGDNNGGNGDNNGDNGDNNGGNGDNNGDNGDNNGGYIDNNNGSSYVDNNGTDYGNDYNNGDNDNNGYGEQGGYEQDYNNDESSYLGGGQTYVEPESIAPSVSLYNSGGAVSEKTLSNNDWNDISERLKNASNSADGGDDFGFIQNNNSLTDNGGWMLIASIVCFALSAAGILYFVVLTVNNKKNSKFATAAETGRTSKSSSAHNYYGDGYRTSSDKRSGRSSKFDTAEVSLPRNSQGKRYKNGGKRYK